MPKMGVLWLLQAHLRLTLNVDVERSFRPYFCAFPSSLWIQAKQSSSTRNCEGSVAVITRYIVLVRHEEELTMVKLFEDKCNIYKGLTNNHFLQRCLCFSILCQRYFSNISSAVTMFVLEFDVVINFWVWAPRDVLVNSNANEEDAQKYMNSDGNIV